MKSPPIILIACDFALYFGTTLGFAVVWHLVWFSDIYVRLNWPEPAEADVPLGALAIATQGLVLALAIDQLFKRIPAKSVIWMISATAFVFLWSSHVIGDAAKCGFFPKSQFIAIETAYLAIQFVIFAVLSSIAHQLLDMRMPVAR